MKDWDNLLSWEFVPQAMLLLPNKKTTKRLREVLNQLYGHLDASGPVSDESIPIA